MKYLFWSEVLVLQRDNLVAINYCRHNLLVTLGISQAIENPRKNIARLQSIRL